MSNGPRKSTQIAVGFFSLVFVGYFGYAKITDAMIMGIKFDELKPAKVNLVGIDTAKGYGIRVANQMAQLIEGVDYDFQSRGAGDESATEGTGKRRIPIREMLDSLKGDEKALGQLVMIMNDKQENDRWPPVRVYWQSADLQKALDGDPVLAKKLEQDLNIKLDGTPLSSLRIASLENGIIVRSPVKVKVRVAGEDKVLTGTVDQPYRPKLMLEVEKQYAEKPNANQTDQMGYYLTESKKVLDNQSRREDVRKSLMTMISDEQLRPLAERPEQILASAKVVVNENFVSKAFYTSKKGPNGADIHDLTIQLTDEGRKRLWQYSKKKVGTQLLLIVDGIAIAAPQISHELSQGELTITKLPDEVLVREAVDGINNKGASS